VAPHNSAMVEVVPGAGITVKGWDMESWKNAIRSIMANRQFYINQGYLRIKSYQWDDIIIRLDNYLDGPKGTLERFVIPEHLIAGIHSN